MWLWRKKTTISQTNLQSQKNAKVSYRTSWNLSLQFNRGYVFICKKFSFSIDKKYVKMKESEQYLPDYCL